MADWTDEIEESREKREQHFRIISGESLGKKVNKWFLNYMSEKNAFK